MRYLEIESAIIAKYKSINPCLKTAFWISFALINLAFLFHSINFMYGDHDWNNLRGATIWQEGSFEGRPLHFLLQSILFDGKILPILNNLFSFLALSLSGILLAHYWNIPKNTFNYALFTTFVAVSPYTLVWLYYAKDALINLSLPLICIASLVIADKATAIKSYMLHIIAILLLIWGFSSYVAVIQLIGIAILGNICLSMVFDGKSLLEALKSKIPTIIDVMISLIVYLLILKTLTMTSEYNTKIIPLDYLPQKLAETIDAMWRQFVMPLPFMEYKFKILLAVFFLLGIFVLLLSGGKSCLLSTPIIVIAMVFCSKFAYFIADERGQILAEMENFAYVPRLDFYGIVYLYALSLASILQIKSIKLRKAGIVFAIILTFMSGVRDMYAQKVWKLGFDAEVKALERILIRLEQHPEFNYHRRYRLLQLGSLSLRKNYYRSTGGESISLDLLNTSYTPEFMPHIVYNFYHPEDIFYTSASVNEVSERGREFILYRAEAWPSQKSIFIDGDIVIVALTEEGLTKARNKL